MSNFVLALTGPAGAGKSTIGEKLAKKLDRCVNIDADNIKHMIVSGFYVDEAHPDNPEGWGFNEWELVGESIGLLAQNFLNHGYDVIINGYIDPPAWSAVEQQVAIDHKVLLLPHLSTVTNRDAARAEDVRMGEVIVSKHHQHFSTDKYYDDFTKLDTTNDSIEQTIAEIEEIINT